MESSRASISALVVAMDACSSSMAFSRSAMLLLAVQCRDEVVDELDHLVEALLPAECHFQEVQAGVAADALQGGKRLLPHCDRGDLGLQEARGTGQSLFEKLQSIVV